MSWGKEKRDVEIEEQGKIDGPEARRVMAST
jgi:hypothetical protein